jgi:uncharacterized damage-inducible protein DinB
MNGIEQHPLRLDDAIAILERTPLTLHALLSGLPDRWIHATEGEGTWSPFDVVGHLIHGEATDWIPRVRHILSGEARPFDPFDRLGHIEASRGRTLDELLDRFAEARAASLAALRQMDLKERDLDRTGTHPAFGTVTMAQLLATWTVHDLDHIVQVARVMAKSYGAAVGPWDAYLSVLHDRRRP